MQTSFTFIYEWIKSAFEDSAPESFAARLLLLVAIGAIISTVKWIKTKLAPPATH